MEHPVFEDYARGVMASELTPNFIKKDEELQQRFPPHELPGLGSGLCWEPPSLSAKAMPHYLRSRARRVPT
jgi:hypothetical protein